MESLKKKEGRRSVGGLFRHVACSERRTALGCIGVGSSAEKKNIGDLIAGPCQGKKTAKIGLRLGGGWMQKGRGGVFCQDGA